MRPSGLKTLCSVLVALAAFTLPASAKEVTLDGATVTGKTSNIRVTYALNGTEKIARVREVRDVSTNQTMESCVIPSKIKVDGTTYKVTIIGKGAFSYNDFDKVVLPNTITEIGEDAFAHVGFLEECVIPSSVIKIGKNAFSNNLLVSVNIPASCTSIGEGAFAYNEIHDLTFSEGSAPLTIGNNAFNYNRLGPWSLVLPARLERLGTGAFSQNDQLHSVIINGRLTEIPARCFYDCCVLSSVTINSPVHTIGEAAFDKCAALENVKLATNSLKSIGKNAFANCNLKALDSSFFLYGLNEIGEGAFRNNTSLSSVSFPLTVSSIGPNAFEKDDRIATIDCPAINVPQLAENAFTQTVYQNCRVNVFEDALPLFRTAPGWRNFRWLTSGTDDIVAAETDTDVKYFNLTGETVDDPVVPGIYIEVRNGRAKKIHIP